VAIRRRDSHCSCDFRRILYRKQRRLKRLDFEVLAQTPLLTVKEELEDKLQILYEGRRIESVDLLLMEFTNSGTEPILPSDFVQPIGVDFGSDSQVLTAEVVETSPPDSNPVIIPQTTGLIVAPLLMNQRDSLRVKCLVEKYAASAKPTGRIVGISTIRMPGEGGILSIVLVLLGMLAFVMGLGLGFWTMSKEAPPSSPLTSADIRFLGIFFSGLFLIVLGFLSDRSARRAFVRSLKTRLLGRRPEPTSGSRRRPRAPQADKGDLTILYARYGAGSIWKDVTPLLRAKVQAGILRLAVTNDELGGDPVPNVLKSIEVTYSRGGRTYSKVVAENEVLSLPEA
jgi:hypothetical protein